MQRGIATHELFGDKRQLETCRNRVMQYASEDVVLRLAAATPCPPSADANERAGDRAHAAPENGEFSSSDDIEQRDSEGEEESETESIEAQSGSGQMSGTLQENDAGGSNDNSTLDPPPPSTSLQPPSRRPRQRYRRSSPELFELFRKAAFDHSQASQSWILCNNLSHYLDIMDAAKVQGAVYTDSWSRLRLHFFPWERLALGDNVTGPSCEGSQCQIGINPDEVDEIIARFVPDVPDSDDDDEDYEFYNEGDDGREMKTEVPQCSGDEVESLKEAEIHSFRSPGAESNVSSRSSETLVPDALPIQARRARFSELHSIEALVFRRLAEHFYTNGQDAKPATFAQLMKLNLSISRVSHQHEQQVNCMAAIRRRYGKSPYRRVRMIRDVASVMKSRGMGSPLYESISAEEEWPDDWSITRVKRRKIHGAGVARPNMTSREYPENGSSTDQDNVQW